MSPFTAILLLECLITVAWCGAIWCRLDGRARRGAFAIGAALIIASLGWFAASREGWVPKTRALTALGMVWSVLAVPLVVGPCLGWWVAAGATRRVLAGWHRHRAAASGVPATAVATPVPEPALPAAVLSRRQLLSSGLAAMPMALTFGATSVGIARASDFRIRRVTLPVRGLPASLVGARIAHVSDAHVGGFTPRANLPIIAAAVAAEHPDLVAFTGDLLDHSLDELPDAIEFCEALRRAGPLYLCEGNHDQLGGVHPKVVALRRALHDRGFDWLFDGDSRFATVCGERVEVQGASWSFRPEQHARCIAAAVHRRTDRGFPLLLMHHPDAFDQAQAAGYPLMLAGHTHGGQLMLADHVGVGPTLFKYWSGTYRTRHSTLFVSNGVGHWFPLRVNAPAEISMLTLARG